jgi:hypothetical protein
MALASVGFLLTVRLVDQGSNKSTLRYDLTAADAATAAADAATIMAALAAVTDAEIQAYSLAEQFQDGTVESGSGEVEAIASIVAKIDSAAVKYASVKIPAPNVGIFKAAAGDDFNNVDPADTALVTYLTVFATGNEAYLSDGEALLSPGTAGNVTGKRIHRASRKG